MLDVDEARTAGMLAVAIALVAPVRAAWSGVPSPVAQLRDSIDRVQGIVNDAALGGPAREAALRRAVERRFDSAATAREALGRYWQDRTPEERRRFTQLFTELLERSYLRIVARYAGAHVAYAAGAVRGAHATVHTRLATRSGRQLGIDYEMVLNGDRWLVYDVIVDDVSLIDNYRSQFTDIIATSSYGTLVRRIEARVRELRAKESSSSWPS